MSTLEGWVNLARLWKSPQTFNVNCYGNWSFPLKAKPLLLYNDSTLYFESIFNSFMLTPKAESTVGVGKGTLNLCSNYLTISSKGRHGVCGLGLWNKPYIKKKKKCQAHRAHSCPCLWSLYLRKGKILWRCSVEKSTQFSCSSN